MKSFLTLSLLSLPAAAQAMYMHGPSNHGGLMAGVAYAVVAVLGYWVLLQAVKESGSVCVKRVGDVLGSILVIVGLLGLLCSVWSHCKPAMCGSCGPGPAPMMAAPGQPSEMGMLPPGHPAVGEVPAQKKPAKPK